MSDSKHTPGPWRHLLDISDDEREAYRFDDTVQFGFGYDWDSYETSCQVAKLPSGQTFKVWRIGEQWSLYGGDLGFYKQGLPSAEAAKQECEKIDAFYAEERARLIAAAPEMLAALMEIAELAGNAFSEPSWGDIDHYKTPLKTAQAKARAAIAKAEGGE